MPDKRSTWLLPAAVGIAGLVIGFAVSSVAYRRGWIRPPRAPFIERMQRQLSLTPAQRAQILDIINQTRAKVMDMREEFEHQRRAQIHQARARVRALLTPEQQEKFDREFRPHEHRDDHAEHEGGAPAPAPRGQDSHGGSAPPPP